MSKFGTREWAEHNKNIYIGCKHNCKYCYARYNVINRFKQVNSPEEWEQPKQKEKEKYSLIEMRKIQQILKPIVKENGDVQGEYVYQDIEEFHIKLKDLFYRNYPTFADSFADREYEIDSFIEDFIKEQQYYYDSQIKDQKTFIESLEELRKKLKVKKK